MIQQICNFRDKQVKKSIKKYEKENNIEETNSVLNTPNTVIATDFTHLYWK